uniref:THAP-type domain-containing protein n=1 Tax=Anopheles epiroticus TaxID=199890 RepID=A0A182PP54_9DIPT
MRNCYVYGCDRRHKDDPKRAMFIVPKDPEKFEEWRQVLPAHRPLRSHDRVCEKHFKPEEIQRDWTYQIGGHTKKLMRAKPVLLPDAIPSIFDSVPPVDRKGTKSRRKQPREPPEEQREVVVVVEQPNQDNDIICVEQTAMVVVIEDESTDVANQPPTAVECNEVEMFQAKPDAAARESIFEELYDNIYEVELPSTLWGVHREPDRKFAAFSRFGCVPGLVLWEAGAGKGYFREASTKIGRCGKHSKI